MPHERRGRPDTARNGSTIEARLGVRSGDVGSALTLLPDTHVQCLLKEAEDSPYVAVIQSSTWMQIWDTASTLCTLLRATVWVRCGRPADALAARSAEVQAVALSGVGPGTPAPALERRREAIAGAETDARRWSGGPRADAWFNDCEQLLALQFAYVAREVVSRTVTALFAAMLCATLLAASHLLYAFSGRSALITVDLLAIAATALISTWILIDMERDTVLSQLRHTTPGRVDLNWAFVQRIVVYGVLPIIVVLAALFPEIGGSLFGWLEPLRKLSAF